MEVLRESSERVKAELGQERGKARQAEEGRERGLAELQQQLQSRENELQ